MLGFDNIYVYIYIESTYNIHNIYVLSSIYLNCSLFSNHIINKNTYVYRSIIFKQIISTGAGILPSTLWQRQCPVLDLLLPLRKFLKSDLVQFPPDRWNIKNSTSRIAPAEKLWNHNFPMPTFWQYVFSAKVFLLETHRRKLQCFSLFINVFVAFSGGCWKGGGQKSVDIGLRAWLAIFHTQFALNGSRVVLL